MKDREELELMLQCCRLYYEHDTSQEQVAQSLGISRPKVSRLLQRAREQGVVQIHIVDPLSRQAELEQALAQAFRLHRVIVTAGAMASEELARQRLGWAGARYVANTVRDGYRIGIGWGRTLHAVVQSLTPVHRQGISVLPLVGGLSRIPPSFQVNELARRTAEALGGTWQPLYSPAFVHTEAEWRALLNSPDTRLVTDQWPALDMAIVGIGHFGFQTELRMLFADYVNLEAERALAQAGAVGDICARFFNLQGEPVGAPPWGGLVGIDLSQLRVLPLVIGIAGGAAKIDAILGALRGGYLKVLITDEPTAQALWDQVRAGEQV